MSTDLKLGTRVTFKRPLRRVRLLAKPWHKVWETDPYETGTYGGIVVGLRTLSDGETVDYESGAYRPTRHFQAVLVARDLYRKPVFVLPEDVQPELTEAAR